MKSRTLFWIGVPVVAVAVLTVVAAWPTAKQRGEEVGVADPMEKIIEEFAKKLPIEKAYDDVASGAAKEIGYGLTDIARALRLFLLPVQVAAAVQERISTFIDRSIRRVPEQQRIIPAPQILAPILEGIRYEPEGTEIEKMFSELLSRAMDKERLGEAHPSYPIIIKQLSSDEAKILTALSEYAFSYTYKIYYRDRNSLPGPKITESDTFPSDLLSHPKMLSFYISHLQALNLVHLPDVAVSESIYSTDGKHIGERFFCEYRLTRFGDSFVEACIGKSRN